MPDSGNFVPANGQYWPIEDSIYVQYIGDCPNPCRKYHVSSALQGAHRVAELVLPFLTSQNIFHKVVRSSGMLAKQMSGKQAGKFITVYLDGTAPHRNSEIAALAALLEAEYTTGTNSPSPIIPKSRPYSHMFIETPLDRIGFIYGGSLCDPTE